MSFLDLTFTAPPLLDLEVSSERDAITATAELLNNAGKLMDFFGFVEAVLDRQKINPPILGELIALPHARTPLVGEILFAAARCVNPVPFGPQGKPVKLIFLFGVPPHCVSEYLAVTAALVRCLRQPGTIDGLLAAKTVEDFSAWFK
jgi:mannitol/fructose-specific phosphotransferase system IIA component (Ntr-type)